VPADHTDGPGVAASPMVELRGVRRRFGEVRALDGVSLSVGRGEVVGLLGHNGAGKTTTVRLLTGILAADAGDVRVHGLDPLADGPVVRRTTGVVSAVPAVDDRLTAWQNLRFAGEVFGVDRTHVTERAGGLLEQLGLLDRADERVGGYSSGMRQRLALARALLADPPLLLLDEPTAALDPVASRDVRDLLGRLVREEDRSVLLCSHNLVEVQRLCDRVVVLEHGRVIADGTPAGLAGELGIGRLRFEIDLHHRARAERRLEAVGLTSHPDAGGLVITRRPGLDVPSLIADLVHADVRIHAVVPEDASLEDVYFALHDKDQP
jgi:ABC-2 type transport system ATP-binding protein